LGKKRAFVWLNVSLFQKRKKNAKDERGKGGRRRRGTINTSFMK